MSMPESCLSYRHLVSHINPSYQNPKIHQMQAMCRTELENISSQVPKLSTSVESSVDGKVNIPHCPAMESSKLGEIITLLRQPRPDPFQIKDTMYPQIGLRMPLESKCHYSLLELSNATIKVDNHQFSVRHTTNSPFDVRPQSGR